MVVDGKISKEKVQIAIEHFTLTLFYDMDSLGQPKCLDEPHATAPYALGVIVLPISTSFLHVHHIL